MTDVANGVRLLTRREVGSTIDMDLYRQLCRAVSSGLTVSTLGPRSKPNRIHQMSPEAIWVSTDRSGGQARRVPGWMFNVAWEELQRSGRVSSQDLATRVQRASAVLAVLGQLPTVQVESTRPLVVSLISEG